MKTPQNFDFFQSLIKKIEDATAQSIMEKEDLSIFETLNNLFRNANLEKLENIKVLGCRLVSNIKSD